MASIQVTNISYVNAFHLRGELRRRPKTIKTINGHEFIDTYVYFEENQRDGRSFIEALPIQSFNKDVIETLKSFSNQVVIDVTGRVKNKRIKTADGVERKFLYLHISNLVFVGNIDKPFIGEENVVEPEPDAPTTTPIDDDLPF